jgi:RNA polymerase sigma factor (TIGR02999 family)
MLRMVSHPHRPQSGHIMCYLNRTYHVLPTNLFGTIDSAGTYEYLVAHLTGGELLGTTSAIGEVLGKWRDGDPEAFEALVSLVYHDLRRIAHRHLRKARPDHTLQTTALVHEVYLHLHKYPQKSFENRAHFVAVCAMLMRQILTEYERSRCAAKRGGPRRPTLVLGGIEEVEQGRPVDLLALDDALSGLARLDPQQSRIVELRFFGGLSIEETGVVLGLSPATVKRHWATARVWLHREMTRATAI